MVGSTSVVNVPSASTVALAAGWKPEPVSASRLTALPAGSAERPLKT